MSHKYRYSTPLLLSYIMSPNNNPRLHNYIFYRNLKMNRVCLVIIHKLGNFEREREDGGREGGFGYHRVHSLGNQLRNQLSVGV